jgi:hypothetical protein
VGLKYDRSSDVDQRSAASNRWGTASQRSTALHRDPASLTVRPGPMHSEGRIISRPSRHLIRRATSFKRPAHPLNRPFSSYGYYDFYSVFAISSWFLPPPPPTLFPHTFPSCVFLLSLRDEFLSLPPFLCPICWERTRTSSLEGCLSGGLSFCLYSFFSCLQGWINFFSLPDGLRHFFGDHN